MIESILGIKSKKIEVVDRQTGTPFVETVFGDDAMKVFYGHKVGLSITSKFLTQRWLSNIYGAYNDAAASKHKIENFISRLNVDVAECEKELSEYQSFNEFFARKLKPGARPLNKDAHGVIAPGDGRLLVFPKINDDTVSYLKWAPIKLFDLFDKNESFVERYRNGSCWVLRLCPADYHRFHFPVSGKVGMTKAIAGDLHSVSPYALEQNIPVYCMNKRTLCTLDSDEFGQVLLMEVGAMFVGSIVQTYRAGMHVSVGDEKGYFKFGGSTVIAFFEKDMIRFDDDIVRYSASGFETYVKMGERLACLASHNE